MIVNLTSLELTEALSKKRVVNPIQISVETIQELNKVSSNTDLKTLKRNADMLATIAGAFAKTSKVYAALMELDSPMTPYLVEAINKESLEPLFLATLNNGEYIILEEHQVD